MRIQRQIEYWTESVACFDPEKLVSRLLSVFPEAVTDWTDFAEEELRRFQHYAQENVASAEQRATMLQQVTTKTRRIGPVYRFYVGDVANPLFRGQIGRYWITFDSEKAMDGETQARIIQFLESLDLGELSIDDKYEKDSP